MLISTKGSLVAVNGHTSTPQVFWYGTLVPNVVGIEVRNHFDEQRVRLWVTGALLPVHEELKTAGVRVKGE